MAKELLFSLGPKDFEVQTFCSGGKGGQHQNKTQSGVRIIHRASGAVGECREHREQGRNKRVAFTRLTESQKFKTWHKLTTAAILAGYASAEAWVEYQMREENLKVETFSPE